MELLIVLVIRLLVPLTILKWPFLGGLLSALLDFFDFGGIQKLTNYQNVDKLLDIYYLSLEVYVISAWQNIRAAQFGRGLFIYRLIGVTLFEFTGIRTLLFIFPNFFEIYFLLYSGYKFFSKKEPDLSVLRVRMILVFVFLGKLYFEYSLHVFDINGWFLKKLGEWWSR